MEGACSRDAVLPLQCLLPMANGVELMENDFSTNHRLRSYCLSERNLEAQLSDKRCDNFVLIAASADVSLACTISQYVNAFF